MAIWVEGGYLQTKTFYFLVNKKARGKAKSTGKSQPWL